MAKETRTISHFVRNDILLVCAVYVHSAEIPIGLRATTGHPYVLWFSFPNHPCTRQIIVPTALVAAPDDPEKTHSKAQQAEADRRNPAQ
jgi:hypothetical protein